MLRLPGLIFFLFVLIGMLCANQNFYAYYTKVQHSATDYFGKYADLIVVLDEDKQLEFTRRTGYQPLWRTGTGTHLVDDMYPGRDKDFEFFYTYVRLIEESQKKIIVHWRYIPDIETLERANQEKDPLVEHGFLGVVHEIFTIYPDGKVNRIIKDASNTSAGEWEDPDRAIKQTLMLTGNGVEHGSVHWGGEGQRDDDREEEERNGIEGRPVIDSNVLVKPVRHWSFDEGLEENMNEVSESVQEIEAEIEGLFTLYKKGISGSALAFDGYYTGIEYRDELEEISNELTLEAWLALDVYPYNEAPIIHQSQNFGEKGYYLGVDPYGYPFLRINGAEIKSKTKIELYKWHHIIATVGNGTISLYQNNEPTASLPFSNEMEFTDTRTKIGLNTDKTRCTDYVRDFPQNLPFIFGIQGALDEIKIYDKALSLPEIQSIYSTYVPEDISSPVKKGVLPGETGKAKQFGAYYKTLPFQELWDNLWRLSDYADVVVKFDHLPTSVIYWHGSNYAANWITEANQWMSDQSSEIWGPHGCSEHMADKQVRHSYVRIIENTPARVMVHWRYPCVDVGYVCTNKLNWSDEYHTIYPDGTGIRKVIWNKGYDTPGFQDIQFFTNPGETALEVVHLQAMTVANIDGDVEKLQWAKPNKVPDITIENATIELLNSKSKYKIFVVFQGGHITPWGDAEQSPYTDDPFAGPWNHWPMHFVPSDGRFAVAHDRVTHFALGANDYAPEFGSLVHYGFTDQSIKTVIPRARFWQNPPEVVNVSGAENLGFNKDEKAFVFNMQSSTLTFTIQSGKSRPVVNPAFVLQNWPGHSEAIVKVNGEIMNSDQQLRQGFNRDADGNLGKIIWMEMNSTKPTELEISVK